MVADSSADTPYICNNTPAEAMSERGNTISAEGFFGYCDPTSDENSLTVEVIPRDDCTAGI